MLEGTKTLAAIGARPHHVQPASDGRRACIRGMRFTASLIVNLVADGMTPAEIIRGYPELEPEDVRQPYPTRPGSQPKPFIFGTRW
jgi:hypothetical protein